MKTVPSVPLHPSHPYGPHRCYRLGRVFSPLTTPRHRRNKNNIGQRREPAVMNLDASQRGGTAGKADTAITQICKAALPKDTCTFDEPRQARCLMQQSRRSLPIPHSKVGDYAIWHSRQYNHLGSVPREKWPFTFSLLIGGRSVV